MGFQHISKGGLDYKACNYGRSRLIYRGPYRMPQALDIAIIGGSETFGKFVAEPYPVLLERQLGRTAINLGAMNAGVDAFLGDPVLAEICTRARVAVVQIMGAQNLSNGYYAVHPRRNDRFVAAYPALQKLYPDVDFSAFSFTGHMLKSLVQAPDRFDVLVHELRRCWEIRMNQLISILGMPVVLLWITEPDPDNSALGPGPLFVTRPMIDRISGNIDGLVQVTGLSARKPRLRDRLFAPIDQGAAELLPGPDCHANIAAALAEELPRVLSAT